MKPPYFDALIADTKKRFASEATGHDFAHTYRVYQTALALAKKEGGDEEIITLAALLHDVDDYKLFANSSFAKTWMDDHKISPKKQALVVQIIAEISFKGSDSKKATTLEGQIVQDADRLDALGAIGIARAFAYGGAKGRVMYDPKVNPVLGMSEQDYKNAKGTTVNHFYEKLFLLEELMNTAEGKAIAHARTLFMKAYLKEFYAEWKGEDLK